MLKQIFLSISLLLILNTKQTKSDLISDQIYLNITNAIPCVRRLNLTHQIGCGNLDTSNYNGVVYLVNTLADLTNINSNYFNDLSKKFIVISTPSMFRYVVDYYIYNDTSKKTNQRFNGIVLLGYDDENETRTNLNPYSDDYLRPNQDFSYYKDKGDKFNAINWNLAGSSYMFQNLKVPLYLINNATEGRSILDCYETFNKKFLSNPTSSVSSNEKLCGMQLGLQMYAAVNSKVCIRRNTIQHTLESSGFCDPLGGFNYYNFVNLRPTMKNSKLILVSTQIDSFTLFEYYTPGASKPITSIIGLLTISDLLSNYRQDYVYDLLFMLFSNEAFDYAGSSRFVYELKQNNFPNIRFNNTNVIIKPSDLAMMVELSEFGNLASNDTTPGLWIHKDPLAYNSNQNYRNGVDNITSLLKSYSNNEIKPVSQPEQALPPSSIQSFLRDSLQIPSVLIADHEINYKNNYYHSIFDNKENLNLEWPSNMTEEDAVNSKITLKFSTRLQAHTTSISKTLYNLLTDNKTDLNNQTDIRLINNLVYCYLYNTTCQLIRSILSSDQFDYYSKALESVQPINKLSFYTTVNDQLTSGIYVTNVLFRYLTRERLAENFNKSECKLDSVSVINLSQTQQRQYLTALYMSSGNYYDNRTLCILSAIYTNTSISPAFLDADNGVLKNTSFYSAWTESQWESKETQMKLFLFATTTIESVTLTIGLGVFILSFVFTFLANKYLTSWLLSGEEVEALNENTD